MMFRLLAVALPCFLLAPEANAEKFAYPQELQCVDGEFVTTLGPVQATHARTVRRLTRGRPSISVASQGSRSALLRTKEPEKRTEDRKLVSSHDTGYRSADVCLQAERGRRAELLTSRRQNRPLSIERIRCSCNAPVSIAATPNDPHYGLEWGLNQNSDIDINAPQAWDKTVGSENVIIAVIDTGVDYNHSDLTANMWRNPAEIAGNSIDDDSNGVVDDVYGYNAITGSGNPMDDNSHGTHCAGTIGARGNNAVGVAGVAWNVKIMGVKFLSSTGGGYLSDAVRALDYVTMMKNRGLPIVASNNSWGSQGLYAVLTDAAIRARNAGVLLVAAAGNDNNNNDAVAYSPANIPVANVITVAAIDNQGNRASFSNYGATTVHVAAPGVSIASSVPNNGYSYMSGTSMAAPHVSGAIALLASYTSQLTWQELRSRLLSTVRPRAAMQGVVSTGGIINLQAMLDGLAYAPPSPYQPTPQPTATPTSTPTLTPTPQPTLTPTPTPTPIPPTPGYFVLSGQVLFQGAPVSGAQLSANFNGSTQHRVTSGNGQFAFDAVYGPLPYTLAITHPDYTFAAESGSLNRSTEVTIQGAAKQFALSILVVSPSKAPISGAVVSGIGGTLQTDGTGTAQTQLPKSASYTFSVTHPSYDFPISTVGVLRGATTRVVVGKPR